MTDAPSRADDPSSRWRFPNRATPAGSTAYYSIRMASRERRDALAALYAWRSEVRAVLDQVSDAGVARIKLDWWRTEIERTFAGEPRHPLSQVLACPIPAHGLPAEPFFEIIATASDQLQRRPPANRDAQRAADEQDLGALFTLMARCESGDDEDLIGASRDAGAWCAQVQRIRDAGWLLRRARPPLSAQDLQAEGVTEQWLRTEEGRQRLPSLLGRLAQALSAEPASRLRRSTLTPSLRAQLRLHEVLLDELARSDFQVADQRISLTPVRKLWIAWRAAR